MLECTNFVVKGDAEMFSKEKKVLILEFEQIVKIKEIQTYMAQLFFLSF